LCGYLLYNLLKFFTDEKHTYTIYLHPAFSSAGNSGNTAVTSDSAVAPVTTTTADVPFEVAKNYFVKILLPQIHWQIPNYHTTGF